MLGIEYDLMSAKEIGRAAIRNGNHTCKTLTRTALRDLVLWIRPTFEVQLLSFLCREIPGRM